MYPVEPIKQGVPMELMYILSTYFQNRYRGCTVQELGDGTDVYTLYLPPACDVLYSTIHKESVHVLQVAINGLDLNLVLPPATCRGWIFKNTQVVSFAICLLFGPH
eukprot:SAG31_NODE_11016_length_1074_cov_0.968205_1_plen_105_part_10